MKNLKTPNIEESFCLLKIEAYLLNKKDYIFKRIKESGLSITEIWSVRLTFGDIFRLYEGWIARTVSLLRVPPLFDLDVYILEGPNAIHCMYNLKHQIRYDIWRAKYKKGGFLHAPDSVDEARRHKRIIERRVVRKFPKLGNSMWSIR
jgi:hypothetical protein